MCSWWTYSSISSVVMPGRTISPARRRISAATAPARRMRAMTSGDLTRGSSHGDRDAGLGVRRAADVRREPCASATRRRAAPGPRSACGSACTCARSRTSTGRWPAAASWVGWRACACAPGYGPAIRARSVSGRTSSGSARIAPGSGFSLSAGSMYPGGHGGSARSHGAQRTVGYAPRPPRRVPDRAWGDGLGAAILEADEAQTRGRIGRSGSAVGVARGRTAGTVLTVARRVGVRRDRRRRAGRSSTAVASPPGVSLARPRRRRPRRRRRAPPAERPRRSAPRSPSWPRWPLAGSGRAGRERRRRRRARRRPAARDAPRLARGMGFGDVKAGAVLGAGAGPDRRRAGRSWPSCSACGAAAAWGLGTRARSIALGPALVAGALAAALIGGSSA